MRLLTSVLVILAALWGGWWYVGSSALETGLKSWISDARRNGIDVQTSEISVQGFPNRFDTTFSDLVLTDARHAITWKAPFFQSFALSYKPWHLVAVWPHQQQLILPGFDLQIGSEDMRASLVLTPDSNLALTRARFNATALSLTVTPAANPPFPGISAGWANLLIRAATTTKGADYDISADRLFVATRQNPVLEFAHDLSVEIAAITLPAALRQQIDPDGALPGAITSVILDATLEFDRDIDLQMASGRAPQLRAIDIRKAEVRWQDLALGIRGRLTSGPNGLARGELELNARNWRAVFAVLAASGLVDPVWEGALAPLALADGTPDDLSTTLTFRDGLTWFGPLPLGPAPELFVN